MSLIHDYVGLLGCLMLLVAAPLIFIRQPRYSRRIVTITITSMILISVIPINGLIIAAYVRGVVFDLSITSIVLLGHFIASAYAGKAYLHAADKKIISWMVLLAAIFLYPFSLGLGPWDSYATGYGNFWLYGLLFVGISWLYITRHRVIAAILMTGIITYLFSLLASTNLWDYLIDPWLVGAMIVKSIYTLALKKPKGSGPEPAPE